MSVKLLPDQHLEFLRLKGGCTGSSESTLVKMPYCWKSHVTAHITKSTVDFLNRPLQVFTLEMNIGLHSVCRCRIKIVVSMVMEIVKMLQKHMDPVITKNIFELA